MNWPNRLTMLRVFMIPVFVALLMLSPVFSWARYAAAGVFIAACITDLLDGKIARRYNLITDFGKFMDPLADKSFSGTSRKNSTSSTRTPRTSFSPSWSF